MTQVSPLAAFLLGAAAGALAAALAATVILRERLRLYGRLLSFCLHELNTPLTAVSMTVVNLLSGVFGEIPQEQFKWIEMSHDQASRLGALLCEVRDLVHLELGQDLRVRITPVPALAIFEDALSVNRRAYSQASVELRGEIEPGLPRCMTDESRGARSLADLLFHARKFRVSGDVLLRAARRDAKVVFEVVYVGPIPNPGQAQNSLDLFYPVMNTGSQVLSATGLGLGFTRELMRRLGGDFEFDVDSSGKARLALIMEAEGTAQ